MNFLKRAKGISLLTAIVGMLSVWASPANAQSESRVKRPMGSVYIQTNGIANEIIHYGRQADGRLIEMARVPTGGKGSGTFKPITGQESAPNAFEGVGSIILTPDRQYLFTTNGGNNTVSSFKIGTDGELTLLDVQPTGQPVSGRSGTAKTLAYAANTRTLYVGHAFGPDHIHMLSVKNGKLTGQKASRSVNTARKTDRIPTQIVLTPDNKFLMVDILFDRRPGMKPDGSPDLAVANMPDEDGLVIFPVNADGGLGEPRFTDAGGAAPFVISFLNGSKDTFINGFAASGGLLMGRIDATGKVTNSPVVMINQSKGMPSELCWIAITPDNKQVLATVFGYSYVSSYKIVNGALQIDKDPAAPAVPGDGTFKALDMLVSSGPSDSWISPDGRHFYQIYPNASKLIVYDLSKDGRLTEIDTQKIPYNSPQGLAGF